MAFFKAHLATQGNIFNLSHDYWYDLFNMRIFHDLKVFLHRLKLREVNSVPQMYLLYVRMFIILTACNLIK